MQGCVKHLVNPLPMYQCQIKVSNKKEKLYLFFEGWRWHAGEAARLYHTFYHINNLLDCYTMTIVWNKPNAQLFLSVLKIDTFPIVHKALYLDVKQNDILFHLWYYIRYWCLFALAFFILVHWRCPFFGFLCVQIVRVLDGQKDAQKSNLTSFSQGLHNVWQSQRAQ